jgi:hypothetical protein
MVKEAKFFRKQATRAEIAARAASDVEVTQGLLAMARGYRQQAALLKKKQRTKKKQKTKPKDKKVRKKPKDKKAPRQVGRPKKKDQQKPRS